MKDKTLASQFAAFERASHSSNWVGKSYREFQLWEAAEYARIQTATKAARNPQWAVEKLALLRDFSLLLDVSYYQLELDDVIQDKRKLTTPLKPREVVIDEQGQITKTLRVLQSLHEAPVGRTVAEHDPFSLRLAAPAVYVIERAACVLHAQDKRMSNEERTSTIEKRLRHNGYPFTEPSVIKYAKWFVNPRHRFGQGGGRVRCFDPATLTDPLIASKFQPHPHVNKGLITLIEITQHHIRFRALKGDKPLSALQDVENRLREDLQRNGCIAIGLQDALIKVIDHTPTRHKQQLELERIARQTVKNGTRMKFVSPANEKKKRITKS